MGVAVTEAPSVAPSSSLPPLQRDRGRGLAPWHGLLLVLLLASGLRFWGLAWGLPWAFHPDEGDYVDRARWMLQTHRLNPEYFKNPSLLTYIVLGEIQLGRALGSLAGPLDPDQPGVMNLLARLDSALIGTASVAVLYGIGSRLFAPKVGLVAALLLAVSFSHVRDSHYGVNDVPCLGLLLVSIYCSVRLLRQPTTVWYVLAGLSGGLATSAKYSAGFFFVPLLAAHFLARRRRPAGNVTEVRREGLAALAGVAGFLLGTPFALLDSTRFRADFASQARLGDLPWAGQPTESVAVLYGTSLAQGVGGLAVSLALVGLVMLWRARRGELCVLLAFPLTYLLFMLPKALFFTRFALPLVPFVCLLAAYSLVRLSKLVRGPWRPAVLAALIAATIAQPLVNDIRHNQLISREDTRILAVRWTQDNLRPDTRLKFGDYTLEDPSWLSRSYLPPEIEHRMDRLEIRPSSDEVRELVKDRNDFVMISSFRYGRLFADASSRQAIQEQQLYQSLAQEGSLVASFTPGRGGASPPFSAEDLYTPFWNLERYERAGPTILVYALPRTSAAR